MIICDLIRTIVLGAITLLFVAGSLRQGSLWVVYLATIIFSTATIFFDVSYVAAMPNIVEQKQLLAGNSYLQTSALTGQLIGPTLAGVAIQVLGAAQALLFDAGSFVVSVISLALIPREFRAQRPAAAPAARTLRAIFQQMLREIGEGLRFIWGHSVLRWTMLLIGANNFFTTCIFLTLFLFRLRNDLHYSAGAIGVIYAFSAVGGIAGSMGAGRLRKSFELLPTALVATIVLSLALVVCALTLPFVVYAAAMLIVGAAAAIMNINAMTLCQIVTPDAMLGRMQSVVRLLTWSPIALGTLLGTALAASFNTADVILVFCAVSAALAVGMFISPIRRVR